MLTLMSEKHGLLVPGPSCPGGKIQVEFLVRPGFQAEMITIRTVSDDRIVISGLPWPYTLIFVFGYSIILYLSQTLKKEIHDRGSHLFHTINDSYKIHFQKDRNYIIFSVHYSSDFLKMHLEESAQPIRTRWELLSPVFYYSRSKVTKRETIEQLSMLVSSQNAASDTDFVKDELAKIILMEFLLEYKSTFQPAYIGMAQFEPFYKERDNLLAVALKTLPISKLLNLSGIKQAPLFRKRLRQLYDMNIREFVTGARMMAALNLLKDPTLSVKQIAGLTGFSNAFYFSRVFRNYFGQSPKSFHAKTQS